MCPKEGMTSGAPCHPQPAVYLANERARPIRFERAAMRIALGEGVFAEYVFDMDPPRRCVVSRPIPLGPAELRCYWPTGRVGFLFFCFSYYCKNSTRQNTCPNSMIQNPKFFLKPKLFNGATSIIFHHTFQYYSSSNSNLN